MNQITEYECMGCLLISRQILIIDILDANWEVIGISLYYDNYWLWTQNLNRSILLFIMFGMLRSISILLHIKDASCLSLLDYGMCLVL